MIVDSSRPSSLGATAGEVFVPLIGQYDNIGDILLRRPLLMWLRPAGRLHVYVGVAPQGYVNAVGFLPDDVVYRSFVAWYLSGLASALRGRAHYAFKPGEIQLTLKGMKEHVSVLPWLALLRLRGGRVVRVGSGVRNFATWPRWLMAPSLALSQLIFWRDARTAGHLGRGGVMPDLAFGDGDREPAPGPRPWLAVSMRGDRRRVPEQWVRAVRALAEHEGLQVRVVTQVARDAQLSRELAARLGCSLDDWDGTAHDVQDQRLQAVYRQSRAVISDRLHVLIGAFTHGAVPIGLLTDASDKVRRHFAAAGIEGVDLQVGDRSVEDLVLGMRAVLAREVEFRQALAQARTKLDQVRVAVLRCLGGPVG